ncbi:LysR family transcriptional regulator [Embleya scabrispora]|uniref:LysR family transcriptional regulator n=1 Tax=Embleya scabrispora TaxID=159449 RepID=UPI00037D6CD5|nr:LysR family transcriptional regulator [Embleya scabrispora]MYS83917.1 LysR family transcriptional regulator [Streptomyces sp. SID5474]
MIDVDVRHLESFIAVAQELNITRAAARVHLTQQAVSGHIQQLERALKVTLLVRTHRGVLLTAAGDELAAGGKAVVAELAELVERVQQVARRQTGSLRLACCPYATSLFAGEVADAMEAAVPGLAVELTTVRTPREELELLEAGSADAAFMWLPVGDTGLRHAVVRTDGRAVAVSRDHRLAGRDRVELADLADEPVVRPDVFASADTERHWMADPRPDGAPAPRGPVVAQIEDALLTVARGRAVWLAPEPLGRWAPPANVRWLAVADAEPSELALVWTEQAPEPLIARLIAEVRAVVDRSAESPPAPA